tara:strand:- start:11859 stop:13430 length:1572 start_codon:yes stop_codon:yes gene_type:complete
MANGLVFSHKLEDGTEVYWNPDQEIGGEEYTDWRWSFSYDPDKKIEIATKVPIEKKSVKKSKSKSPTKVKTTSDTTTTEGIKTHPHANQSIQNTSKSRWQNINPNISNTPTLADLSKAILARRTEHYDKIMGPHIYPPESTGEVHIDNIGSEIINLPNPLDLRGKSVTKRPYPEIGPQRFDVGRIHSKTGEKIPPPELKIPLSEQEKYSLLGPRQRLGRTSPGSTYDPQQLVTGTDIPLANPAFPAQISSYLQQKSIESDKQAEKNVDFKIKALNASTLNSIGTNSVDVGKSESNLQQTVRDNQNAMVSLLGSGGGGYEPSTGWERFFKILSGMGGRSGVSIAQDVILSNQALQAREGAAAKAALERRLKAEDLAQKRRMENERLKIAQENLAINQNRNRREELDKFKWGKTKDDQGRVAILIRQVMEEGNLGKNLKKYIDDFGKGWFELFSKGDFTKEQLAAALTGHVTIEHNKAIDKGEEIPIRTAIERALSNLRETNKNATNKVPSIANTTNLKIENQVK